MSRKILWVIIVILLLIIFSGVIYLGFVYISNQNNQEATEQQTMEEQSTDQNEGETNELSPAQMPQDVVGEFMNSTLGTLPGAEIDMDLAKSHMTSELKSYYTGDNWVPEFYGIQAGPDSFTTLSTYVVDDSATVKINVTFGDSGIAWAFVLKKIDNAWKIDEFRNDAQ